MFEHGSLVSTKGYKVCYMKNGESICEDYADYDIITHYVSENPRIEFHTKYYNSQVCEVCGETPVYFFGRILCVISYRRIKCTPLRFLKGVHYFYVRYFLISCFQLKKFSVHVDFLFLFFV